MNTFMFASKVTTFAFEEFWWAIAAELRQTASARVARSNPAVQLDTLSPFGIG
jgi:hypothetical protein